MKFINTSSSVWLDTNDSEWNLTDVGEISIGSASVTYAGKALTLPVWVGAAQVTVSGQALTLPYLIGAAQVDYVGSELRVFNVPMSSPLYPPACGYWYKGESADPVWDFEEQATLPIPYHEHPVRPEICGHWHKTGETQVYNPVLFGAGSNYYGELGLAHLPFYKEMTPVLEDSVQFRDIVDMGLSYWAVSAVIRNNGDLYVTGTLSDSYAWFTPTVEGYPFTYFGSGFSKVAVGEKTLLAVKQDGTLWAIGGNTRGQLGLGDTTFRGTLEQVGTDTNWADVAVSKEGDSTAAIKTNGTLWTWGYNNKGQLGHGDTTQRTTPTQVGSATDWAKIAFGYWFLLAMKDNGALYGCGYNNSGQLGLGDTTDRLSLTQEVSSSAWVSMTAGRYHSMGIKTNGTLWSCGSNGYGQLGFVTPGVYKNFTQVGSDTNWTVVSAGYNDSYAINSIGELYGSGENSYGELGLGHYNGQFGLAQITEDLFIKVEAGAWNVLAVKEDGTLHGAGWNYNGELGVDYTARIIFSQINEEADWAQINCGWFHTVAIKSDKTLWGWGYDYYGELGVPYDDDAISAISTPRKLHADPVWLKADGGKGYTMALRQDGTLWATGYNGHGQLGLGDTTTRYEWTQVGSDMDWVDVVVSSFGWHTLALKSNGTVWICGYNYYGQLGFGDTTDRLVLTQLGSATNWTFLGAGELHTMLINSSGELWVCGSNFYGQLGLGDNTDRLVLTKVGTDTDWGKCYGGGFYAFALKTNGAAYSTGNNDTGQLAHGGTSDVNSFTLVSGGYHWRKLALGVCSYGFSCCHGGHVLGIQVDGTLWTVGRNPWGQLGQGIYDAYVDTFQKIIRDDHNETVSTWKDIGAGIEHSMAIKTPSYYTIKDAYPHSPVWEL